MALVESKTFPCAQYGSISHISVIPHILSLGYRHGKTADSVRMLTEINGFFSAIIQLHTCNNCVMEGCIGRGI